MELNLEQVQAFINENQESQEVTDYVKTLNPINLTGVQSFLNENEDAKKYFDSEKDKHFSKGLETWKSNNLEKLLEDKIKERFPDTSPADIKIKELEEKIKASELKALRSELQVKAGSIAKEKNLPYEMTSYLIGDNEETTLKNLEVFENVWKQALKQAVEGTMAGNSFTPSKPGQPNAPITSEQVAKMSSEEIEANWDKIQHLFK